MIVLGLGGNVGDDAAIVGRFGAVASAFATWGPVRASSVYRTAPIGGVAQGAFLNAAIRVRPDVDPTPRELIEVVLETELLLGRDRRREARWGPRTIDIDVLLWNDRVAHTPGLEVPHPRLAERAFALRPVADLLGEAHVIPGTGQSIDALLRACGDQGVALTELTITVS